MLVRLRQVNAAKRSAGCAELVLASEWADAHPDLEPVSSAQRRAVQAAHDAGWMAESSPGADKQAGHEWLELGLDARVPDFDWSCSAPLAAALGTSTAAGERLMREALFLRHRMPRIWRQVVASEIEAFRARRVAAALFAQPDDVVDHLDRVLESTVSSIGIRGLDDAIDAAMDLLHAEERELAQLDALDAVSVELDETTMGHTGVASLQIRAEWKDLSDFEDAVTAVAAALRMRALDREQIPELLDVRRAAAVGWLADPARAAALLANPTCSTEELVAATNGPGGLSRPVQLVVHLSPEVLTGDDPVATLDHSAARIVLAQQVAAWCQRETQEVQVMPVIDLATHQASRASTVTDVMALRTALAQPTCAFPHCSRRSSRCDKDHLVASSRQGSTCDCNLVPLCRRHHRLKTHAGWAYRRAGPREYLWTEPHGQVFLCSGEATFDLTHHATVALRDRPEWDGCSQHPPAA